MVMKIKYDSDGNKEWVDDTDVFMGLLWLVLSAVAIYYNHVPG